MVAAYVTAKKATKEANVKYQLVNVKCRAVRATVVVLKANVIVNVALKAMRALNVSYSRYVVDIIFHVYPFRIALHYFFSYIALH